MKKSIAIVLAAVFAASGAWAQQQPIRIVVPTTAGGPIDIVARALAAVLARNMKEVVIVDNKPGAGAMIGTDYVAKAPPDGRTLLLASGYVVTNAVLFKTAPDPVRDFKPARVRSSKIKFRWYGPDIHVASFALPAFLKKAVA